MSDENMVRPLPCKLTDAERLDRARTAAAARHELAELEAKKTAANKAHGAASAQLEAKIDDYLGRVASGEEPRMVECEERRDDRRYCVEIIRLDTLAVIDSRPMDDLEMEQIRQPRLPGVETKTPPPGFFSLFELVDGEFSECFGSKRKNRSSAIDELIKKVREAGQINRPFKLWFIVNNDRFDEASHYLADVTVTAESFSMEEDMGSGPAAKAKTGEWAILGAGPGQGPLYSPEDNTWDASLERLQSMMAAVQAKTGEFWWLEQASVDNPKSKLLGHVKLEGKKYVYTPVGAAPAASPAAFEAPASADGAPAAEKDAFPKAAKKGKKAAANGAAHKDPITDESADDAKAPC